MAQIRIKAEQGDAQSQTELGYELVSGNLVKAKDAAEGVEWYRKAAEQGHAMAQCNLGYCYEHGLGVARDEAEAVRWYRKAAQQDLAIAQYNLGLRYYYGRGVTEDISQAAGWFAKAAGQNHGEAQNYMGVCCENGRGVARDEAEAVQWYRKAAAQGVRDAQYNLGNCYNFGRGVAKDETEAVSWYRKASFQNYALAQYNLGLCYARGLGVGKDHLEAYHWMLLAAAQGDPSAKRDILTLESLLSWDQRADGQRRASEFKFQANPFRPGLQAMLADSEPVVAASGGAQAQNQLGEDFYSGKGGQNKNLVLAAKLFRSVAEQDFAPAQRNLGSCYEKGDGVVKCYIEAYKWYSLAAARGDDRARRNVTLLELLMPRDQVAEGRQRARDWREKFAAAAGKNP